MKFTDLQNQVIELVHKGENREALLVMEEGKASFPQKRDRLCHWKANIYVMDGKQEEALAELNDALENGFWWNPEILTSDPELKSLRTSPEFQRLVAQCLTIFEAEKEAAQVELEVQGNPKADTVIFPLHWKGSNGKEFALQWTDEKIGSKYFLGFPQSSQLFSYQCYSWDDAALASKDVRRMYHQFEKDYNVSRKKMILAGASQGGNIATQMSLNADVEECDQFIAIVPAFDLDALEEVIRTRLNPNVRGCIITGDKDPFYEGVMEAVQLFEKNNISCKLIVKEGMGHTLPDDFPNVLDEAVRFVTNSVTQNLL
ncbi:MAG: DUF3089 domain-containing protein [Anaerobacillus sp.]